MMSAVRCASHIKCLRRGRHQASRAATTNGNLNALVRDENWRLCFAQFSAIGLEILHSGVADDGDDRRVWTKLFREPQGAMTFAPVEVPAKRPSSRQAEEPWQWLL